jgi:hypothetical protein
MSSISNILGILSEQTRFSITVHRFRDSIDSFGIAFRCSQTSGSWQSVLLNHKDDTQLHVFVIQKSHLHSPWNMISPQSKNAFCRHIYKQPVPWDRHQFTSPNHVIQAIKPLQSAFAWLRPPFSGSFFTHSVIQYLIKQQVPHTNVWRVRFGFLWQSTNGMTVKS